ncbi:MAG: Nucleotidyltransferase domain protein [Chlorobi bacterium OLB5]|nr:MAG: Nucleotidyltransferase domain protein [Chlorobi bacterium OLB5]
MKEKIRNIIEQNLNGYTLEKIILFGSRARGNNDIDSDYDVLVIIKEEPDWITRENLCSKIRKVMAKEDVNIDILIRSSNYIETVQNEQGNVINTAIEEGIEM